MHPLNNLHPVLKLPRDAIDCNYTLIVVGVSILAIIELNKFAYYPHEKVKGDDKIN